MGLALILAVLERMGRSPILGEQANCPYNPRSFPRAPVSGRTGPAK